MEDNLNEILDDKTLRIDKNPKNDPNFKWGVILILSAIFVSCFIFHVGYIVIIIGFLMASAGTVLILKSNAVSYLKVLALGVTALFFAIFILLVLNLFV